MPTAVSDKSGMVDINMPYTAFPGIPFGGYKQSGLERELSIDTLDLYLETKAVGPVDGLEALQPLRAVAPSTHPRVRGGYAARGTSLVFGLFIFALGVVLILRSKLGLSPWDVLSQGPNHVLQNAHRAVLVIPAKMVTATAPEWDRSAAATGP